MPVPAAETLDASSGLACQDELGRRRPDHLDVPEVDPDELARDEQEVGRDRQDDQVLVAAARESRALEDAVDFVEGARACQGAVERQVAHWAAQRAWALILTVVPAAGAAVWASEAAVWTAAMAVDLYERPVAAVLRESGLPAWAYPAQSADFGLRPEDEPQPEVAGAGPKLPAPA